MDDTSESKPLVITDWLEAQHQAFARETIETIRRAVGERLLLSPLITANPMTLTAGYMAANLAVDATLTILSQRFDEYLKGIDA